ILLVWGLLSLEFPRYVGVCAGARSVVKAAAAGDADSEFELCYLDEVLGVERRDLPESWPGLRPEEFMPVRGFRWARGQAHMPGLWWFATTGAHVGYESWLERDHVMLLDFDPEVAAIASQPFWLRWRDGDGHQRRHAPDYFARMEDGSAVVIDVRPDDRIEPRDAEAFEVTGRASGLAGWRFVRAGVPDPVRTANVAWLSRYRPRGGGAAGGAEGDELTARGHRVTASAIAKRRRRYQEQGLPGMVDHRAARQMPADGQADAAVVAAMRQAIGEATDEPTRTAVFVFRRTRQILADADAAVRMPSERSLYRL